MELAVAVASGFALALIAPSVHRVLRDGAGWALALLPAGLAVYFAGLLPGTPRGGPRGGKPPPPPPPPPPRRRRRRRPRRRLSRRPGNSGDTVRSASGRWC